MKTHSRAVHKIDARGNIIATYASVAEAEADLDLWQNNIIQCCRGTRRRAGGFMWKYVEEDMR